MFSGKSEAKKFTELPWVKKQLREKLGFDPCPGTLNLKVDDPARLKEALSRAKPVVIKPVEGFCGARCYRARLKDVVNCAVVVPEIAGYPEGVLEIVAATNLRSRFRLNDGDVVDVAIKV